MKRELAILCLLMLAGFYIYVGWLALHPQVEDAYRMYYIERSLKTWPRSEQGSGKR